MNTDTEALFLRCARHMMRHTHFGEESAFIQHGRTTTRLHSLAVAYYSLISARRLGLRVRESALVRGALLHDYYLYDWHIPEGHDRWHGFTHPDIALKNAIRDLPEPLTDVERNIIANHMFPLTLRHVPTCRESLIVCLVDKLCSIYEMLPIADTYPRMREMEARLLHDTRKG